MSNQEGEPSRGPSNISQEQQEALTGTILEAWQGRFLKDRDFIFLIDNHPSMKPHWEAMTRTLDAMVDKTLRSDQSVWRALALAFATGQPGSAYRLDVAGINQRVKMAKEDLMESEQDDKADMAKALTTIFDLYSISEKRKTTLVVLTTDSCTAGGGETSVPAAIIEFFKDKFCPYPTAEDRWFTIEFVYFGERLPEPVSRLYANIRDSPHVPENTLKLLSLRPQNP
ncbi:hypothetical protein GGR52DRAFT_576122 [Hypoxylon sp. FL1284]|nr:hypothetical protein GGR52DRAFT_576122 [Hypoxylon sp. FL1284]